MSSSVLSAQINGRITGSDTRIAAAVEVSTNLGGLEQAVSAVVTITNQNASSSQQLQAGRAHFA